MTACEYYCLLTVNCIRAGSFCTPRLREELSQLSLQALYRIFEVNRLTGGFWSLISTIIDMLHHQVSHNYLYSGETVTNKCQNLSKQFPQFIIHLPTVCFQAFHKPDLDETLILLVYEAHYSHILEIEASNPASTFPLRRVGQRIRGIIKRIGTLHPHRHKLKFTMLHYALVALYWMDDYLNSGSSR